MKIAIITFHKTSNLGAGLQAYALFEFLKRMGHDAFFIDYLPDYLFKKEKFPWFPGIRPSTIKRNVVSRYRWRKFYRQFSLSSLKYESPESLKMSPPIADAYICGSDQIWNSGLLGRFDDNYYLSFVPREKLRIAYAPSCGGDTKLEQNRNALVSLLRDFDALSIREEKDGQFLKHLTGLTFKTVLDPTLLYGEYRELIGRRPIKEDYILIYLAAEYPSFLAETLQNYRKNFRCKSIDITNWGSSSPADKSIKDIGPIEFLTYFYHARFVLTNSYHGTVFSVIFNKPFQGLKLSGHFSNRQVRQDNLLTALEMSEIVYREHCWDSLEEVASSFLKQYSISNKILHGLQDESRSFLANALQRKRAHTR